MVYRSALLYSPPTADVSLILTENNVCRTRRDPVSAAGESVNAIAATNLASPPSSNNKKVPILSVSYD